MYKLSYVIRVSAPDLDEQKRRCDEVKDFYDDLNVKLVRPAGDMMGLHGEFLPASNFMLQKGKDVEIDGYKGFIFMAKSGRPLMPSAINNILYNIVDAYNKKEVQIAKTEHRNAELLPKVSAHIMRHTACTRMAEKRIDVKVLQYIMGHAHIDVTMDVYNHVSEMSRIESEITRLESVAIS